MEEASEIMGPKELLFAFYSITKQPHDKYITYDKWHPEKPFLVTHPKSETCKRQVARYSELVHALGEVRQYGNAATEEAATKLQVTWEAGARDLAYELTDNLQARWLAKLVAHYHTMEGTPLAQQQDQHNGEHQVICQAAELKLSLYI